MSDPSRLFDSHADPRVRAALRRGAELEPPVRLKDHVWAGVVVATTTTASLAAAATGAAESAAGAGQVVASGAGAAGASIAKASVPFGLIAKWIAVGGTAGSLALGGHQLVTRANDSPSQGAPSSTPPSAGASGKSPSTLGRSLDPSFATAPDDDGVDVVPWSALSAKAPPSAAPESDVNAGDAGTEEAALILRARQALRAGQPSTALEILSAPRSGAESTLSQEREVLRIEALSRLGNTADARRHATDFLERFPKSPHAERVRRTAGTQ